MEFIRPAISVSQLFVASDGKQGAECSLATSAMLVAILAGFVHLLWQQGVPHSCTYLLFPSLLEYGFAAKMLSLGAPVLRKKLLLLLVAAPKGLGPAPQTVGVETRKDAP
jgi:hypothetical protein